MPPKRMAEEEQEHLRVWLRSAIAISGLSASGLAKKAGVAQTTLTRFINHLTDVTPSWRTITKVAEAAGVTLPGVTDPSGQIIPWVVNPLTGKIRDLKITTPPDQMTLIPETTFPKSIQENTSTQSGDYLRYCMSLRSVIGELYVMLITGAERYPEVGDLQEPLAAISQLDAWANGLVRRKYAAHA